MDAGDDDLGDFFSEINKIDDELVPTTTTAAEENVGGSKEDAEMDYVAGVGEMATTTDNTIEITTSEQPVAKKPRGPQVIASAPVLLPAAAVPPTTVYIDGSYSSSSMYSSSSSSSSSSSHMNRTNPVTIGGRYNIESAAPTSSGPTEIPWKPPLPSAAPVPPVVCHSDKTFVRTGAGEVWVDDTLQDWPENDYRIFVGDLGKETSTEMLHKAFQHYKSFAKARVIRKKADNKAKGYGFVSFMDPMDCAKAIREQNGKYLGTRPMKILRSDWKDRDIKEVRKKDNKKRKMKESLGLT